LKECSLLTQWQWLKKVFLSWNSEKVALGMTLPENSSIVTTNTENQVSQRKRDEVVRYVEALHYLMKNKIRARDIMTKKAFESIT
jgi:dihydroxyacid dehydratase/phosphogluconate dehydratase